MVLLPINPLKALLVPSTPGTVAVTVSTGAFFHKAALAPPHAAPPVTKLGGVDVLTEVRMVPLAGASFNRLKKLITLRYLVKKNFFNCIVNKQCPDLLPDDHNQLTF